jgi:hypothetical protein
MRGGDVAVILTDSDLTGMQGFLSTYMQRLPNIFAKIRGNKLITRNADGLAHAEDIGMTLLSHSSNPIAITEGNVLELYTELSPCRRCARSLNLLWPTVAESKVTWSFKYGDDVHMHWKNLSVAKFLQTRVVGLTGVTFLDAFNTLPK